MKCAILNCKSTIGDKKSTGISFHGFPTNPRILTAWVAATGVPHFIPTHRSRVCSIHFEDEAFKSYNRLTPRVSPDAIPTLFLNEPPKPDMGHKTNSDSVACVLSTDQSINEVQVTRDDLPSEHESTKQMDLGQPPAPTPEPSSAPASTIKCVDMKKLLNPQAVNRNVNLNEGKQITNSPSVSKTVSINYSINKINDYVFVAEPLVKSTGITASQVLNRLREILPGKFDLSRMIPNEKVISLVIRYLKLDEKNWGIQQVVKEHLKLIIESMKEKDKKSINLVDHPYNRLSDASLKRALALILPKHFSITDINNELLGLICVSLGLDIHVDAYHILIGKIRQHTSEGQMFKEILSGVTQIDDTSMEVEEDADEERFDKKDSVEDSDLSGRGDAVDVKPDCVAKKGELLFVDVGNIDRSSQESDSLQPAFGSNSPRKGALKVEVEASPPHAKVEKGTLYKKKRNFFAKENKWLDDEGAMDNKKDKDWNPDTKCEEVKDGKVPEPKKLDQPKPNLLLDRVDEIVEYLKKENCTAENVLSDYVHLFTLCRFLKVRPRNSNVKKLEAKLNFMVEKNINVDNIEDFIPKKVVPVKPPRQKTLNPRDDKLNMMPVVVLRDVLEFSADDLFNTQSNVKHGSHKRIQFSAQSQCIAKYPTERVQRITDKSFKKFRKIIFKKDGAKVGFRVKYMKLSPGTVVYAKNYRLPGTGWVKGRVRKQEGPLTYQVELENNTIWHCTNDQLRPLLDTIVSNTDRRHRFTKQMFDL